MHRISRRSPNRQKWATSISFSAVACGALALVILSWHTASGQIREFGLSETAEPQEFRGFPEGASFDEVVVGKLQALTLHERVAQLMMVTLEGTQNPSSSDRELLKRYPPGGVILSAVLQPDSAAKYIQVLRESAIEVQKGIPFLIGTNLYSLSSTGLGKSIQYIRLPTLLAMAAAGDRESTESLATNMAEFLTSMGFNLHMGPSLELAPAVTGIAGSVHTLGSNPAFVARAGVTLLNTLSDRGIIGVAMGFPGGGQNHYSGSPAVLVTPRAQLGERDLYPYAQAIAQSVPIVHVANTLVPTLEHVSSRASMSSVVMTDILRHELNFEGIVMAGPVDDPMLAATNTPSSAAILSLLEGADMVLWNGSGIRVMKSVEDIVAAIGQGILREESINASVARVIGLKERMGLLERAVPTEKSAQKITKRKQFTRDAYQIERRSVTILQNRGNLLPLNKDDVMPIGVTGVIGVEELHDALEEYIQPIAQQQITTALHTGQIQDFEITRITRRIKGIRTAICVFSNSVRPEGQLELLRQLRRRGIRVVVVLMGYPRLLPLAASADAIILTYSDESFVEESMKAVADVLVGQGPLGIVPPRRQLLLQLGEVVTFNALEVLHSPTGRLPVTINTRYRAGMGLGYDPTFALKKVQWDFGDGHGATKVETKHTYKKAGRYPVKLKVLDKKGYETTATFHIIVE